MKAKVLCLLNSKNREVNIMLFAVIVLIVVIAIAPFMPDEKPGVIMDALRKQGYEVDNIDFEFLRKNTWTNEWIYESSEPIYYENEYVSQWLIKYTYTGTLPNMISKYAYRVEPYLPSIDSENP